MPRPPTTLAGRRRFWRGPAPILFGALAWLGTTAGWRALVEPRLPAPLMKWDPAPRRFVDLEGARVALFLSGNAASDGLLVVGDSRTQAGVSLRLLDAGGVGPAGVLSAGLAPLETLLEAARGLPPRRLLVCLSPASIYAETLAYNVAELERERGKSLPRRIDERLDDDLDVYRRRLLRTLEPDRWGRGRTLDNLDPDAQTDIYKTLLRPETHGLRWERTSALHAQLRALQEDGWRIAATRLPTSASITEVEDRALPRGVLAAMCAQLEVPYLDLTGEQALTKDGSHLIGADAERMTRRIADWLATQPGFAR